MYVERYHPGTFAVHAHSKSTGSKCKHFVAGQSMQYFYYLASCNTFREATLDSDGCARPDSGAVFSEANMYKEN